ncbi:hypothetical protein [Noviherbaspirillum humi]|uniref:hypothetical protein n=1 Tax=Noviherbaspirillum humi TaxID=1688639 RepID=UPI0011608483|nr:hypothetical protein [Noviherbaspirillum humi]
MKNRLSTLPGGQLAALHCSIVEHMCRLHNAMFSGFYAHYLIRSGAQHLPEAHRDGVPESDDLRREHTLDEALMESFPASDPVAISLGRVTPKKTRAIAADGS